MAERVFAPGEESAPVRPAFWFSSSIRVGRTLQNQESPATNSYDSIVGTPTGFQQSKRIRVVPEGQLDELPANDNGVPGTPGRRLIRFFGRAENRPKSRFSPRWQRPLRCPSGESRARLLLRR